jgi:hypothetical protein
VLETSTVNKRGGIVAYGVQPSRIRRIYTDNSVHIIRCAVWRVSKIGRGLFSPVVKTPGCYTVGRMFWWKSLAGNVAKFVSTCVACQRIKARRHKPYGLLQPLPVPEKPWHTVTFDFIVKARLPKTSRGNHSICVFVDKLTKLVHFVACKELAELYVDHVFCLHGLSREFITDRDT